MNIIEDFSISVLITIIITLFLFWKYTTSFNYWKIRGIQYATPLPFFGNICQVALMVKPMTDVLQHLYNHFNGLRYFGAYLFSSPILIVRDPLLIKDILVKNFHSFHDKGYPNFEHAYPLLFNIFTTDGNRWAILRKEFTKLFQNYGDDNGFDVILQSGLRMRDVLFEATKSTTEVEVKEVFVSYASEISGLYYLGLQVNSVKDVFTKMRNIVRQTCGPSWVAKIKQICMLYFPNFIPLINILEERRSENLFVDFTTAALEFRDKRKIVRNDFFNLLLELKHRNEILKSNKIRYIQPTEAALEGKNEPELEFNTSLIAAHVFQFIMCGAEIISVLLTFCMYELAMNKHIQVNLRNEIEANLIQNRGNITYRIIKQMEYMDQVVNECLRKYFVCGYLNRVCTEPYTLPGSNLILEKGDRIIIPVHAIHNDPKYYPHPELFDPSRFSKENRKSRQEFTFLPFGEGPRNCICSEFCLLQMKVGLFQILHNFKVKLPKKVKTPLKIDAQTMFTMPSEGVRLHVEPIK